MDLGNRRLLTGNKIIKLQHHAKLSITKQMSNHDHFVLNITDLGSIRVQLRYLNL